jgi:hypothetical protein
LIEEKRALLERVIADKGMIAFTHDPDVAAARVRRDDAGRFSTEGALTTLDWM